MVHHAVAFDRVPHAPGHEDPIAVGQERGVDRGCVRVVVVVDQIADDRGLTFRVALLVGTGVGHDARTIVPERGVHDVKIAAGVGSRVSESVVLREHGVDDHIATEALADIKPGVRAASAVAVIELTVIRVERVHAVITVAVRGEVRAPEVVRAGPEKSVARVVASRHVLDDDTVGVEHADSVLEFESAVEDDRVPVDPADRDVRRGHVDGLAVHTLGDQHQIALVGGAHRFLDRGVVLRDAHRLDLFTLALRWTGLTGGTLRPTSPAAAARAHRERKRESETAEHDPSTCHRVRSPREVDAAAPKCSDGVSEAIHERRTSR